MDRKCMSRISAEEHEGGLACCSTFGRSDHARYLYKGQSK